MKKTKKAFAFLLTLMMILSSFTGFIVSAETELPDGAKFTQVNDYQIEGSEFFIYVASELYSPSPMLTPIIYVYPDAPYASREEAWNELVDLGLLDIAEAEKAAVIMLNPVGEEWGQADIDVYESTHDYVSFTTGVERLTYYNLMYAIGEGSGSTFINNYLSANCKRIAGVLTFGGTIDSSVERPYALPAYLVGQSTDSTTVYRRINNTDTTSTERLPGGTKRTYTNSSDPIRKVIEFTAGPTSFDKDYISECWTTMFRYTTRTCLADQVFDHMDTTVEFTLCERPNIEELGLTLNEYDDTPCVEGSTLTRWYEWVPNEAYDTIENGTDEKYPLILVLHGTNDHPIYEAESNGWVQLAGEERLIIAAPWHQYISSAVEPLELARLIDRLKQEYPIDESRIYCTGFSAGSMATDSVAVAYPETFAAVASMSGFRSSLPITTELPYCYSVGSTDQYVVRNGRYYSSASFDQVRAFNNVPQRIEELDYDKYPLWGFGMENTTSEIAPQGIRISTGSLSNEEGVPMMHFVEAEGITHAHYPEYASYLWDWMSQFRRDPETKEVIYLDGATENEFIGAPESANVGESFDIVLNLKDGYNGVKLVNEKGNTISLQKVSLEKVGTVNQWTLTTNVGTAGVGRNFTLYVKQIGGEYEEFASLTMDIIQPTETTGLKATISGVDIPESFSANTTVSASVKTNSVAKNIKLTNENDNKIGTKVVAKSVLGQQITWNIEFSIGTAGNRLLTFNAAKADKVYDSTNAYIVPVVVTK